MTSKVQPAADYWTDDVKSAARCKLLNHWPKKAGDEIALFLLSRKMAASRFRSFSEENIAQLLNDKDSENTKKSTNQHRLIFESYLEEKNIRNPTTAVDLEAVLRKFCAEARKKDGQVQNCLKESSFSPFRVYFEWIIKQLLNSAFEEYEALGLGG